MDSTATWESERQENVAQPDENSDVSTSNGNLSTLKQLVLRLLCEVQSIAVNPQNLEAGLDFYDEVSRFEIDLIKRALLQTGGHQVRAAKLLNLKVTTLNSKIKHYKIDSSAFGSIYPLIEPRSMEDLQHA